MKMDYSRKLVSLDIVTSTFNEENNIDELYSRLTLALRGERDYSWRLIICDNFSEDATWEKIVELAKRDSRVLGIRLTRNFKLDNSLSCGLDQCAGDVAIFMASDLEDPPEMIPDFLRLYEKGNLHVAGRVIDRDGIGILRKLLTKYFYVLISRLSGNLIVQNVSDFRLVDKVVYVAARELKERHRFLRGIFSWTGYAVVTVPFSRPRRKQGVSKFDSAKLLFLLDQGLEYLYAYTKIPLKIISLVGLLFGILGMSFLVVFILLTLIEGVPFAGFGSLMGVLLLGFAVIMLNLGVMGSYLGLVYEEVKQRPTYIIRNKTRTIKSKKKP